MPEPLRVSPFTLVVPTGCHGCFIEVGHSEAGDEWKFLNVGVLSDHLSLEYWRWLGFNGRLRRAWRALRGHRPPTLEFYSRAEYEDFMAALVIAGKEAFDV